VAREQGAYAAQEDEEDRPKMRVSTAMTTRPPALATSTVTKEAVDDMSG
jgi:hypothetical protein